MRCGCGAGRDLSSIVDVDPRAGLRASRSEHASFSLTSPISSSFLFSRLSAAGIAAISSVCPSRRGAASTCLARLPFIWLSTVPRKSTRCFPSTSNSPLFFSVACWHILELPSGYWAWGTSLSLCSSKAAGKNSNGGNTEVKGHVLLPFLDLCTPTAMV